VIVEFTAGYEIWHLNTDSRYAKICDKETNKTLRESHNLGLICQLEDGRIAAYEGTYGQIGVSDFLTDTHWFQQNGPGILWMADTPT